jgi:hypothetical protein
MLPRRSSSYAARLVYLWAFRLSKYCFGNKYCSILGFSFRCECDCCPTTIAADSLLRGMHLLFSHCVFPQIFSSTSCKTYAHKILQYNSMTTSQHWDVQSTEYIHSDRHSSKPPQASPAFQTSAQPSPKSRAKNVSTNTLLAFPYSLLPSSKHASKVPATDRIPKVRTSKNAAKDQRLRMISTPHSHSHCRTDRR